VIARNPRLTFEDALPHWAPDHEFAQIANAGSTSLPYVEGYLNRVMAQAAEEISDPVLRAQIGLFCAQEGNHYRQHKLFNKLLYPRYPGLLELERALGADYERMLKTARLLENAAYCEGFESLGLIHGEFFFEHSEELLRGADARLVRLWQWHLAEEYEHRSVCFEVHRALGGGYFSRVRGFLRAMRHLDRYGRSVAAHLLSIDRSTMSAAARAESLRRERRYRARFLRFAWPRLLAVLLPGYDPRQRRAWRGAAALLEQIRPGTLSG